LLHSIINIYIYLVPFVLNVKTRRESISKLKRVGIRLKVDNAAGITAWRSWLSIYMHLHSWTCLSCCLSLSFGLSPSSVAGETLKLAQKLVLLQILV